MFRLGSDQTPHEVAGIIMTGFVLGQNTARCTAMCAEEHGESDRQVAIELLAKALRDYAVSEAGSAGVMAEIDIGEGQAQKPMFRNFLGASDDPHLLLTHPKVVTYQSRLWGGTP